jgi:uncharacterized protein
MRRSALPPPTCVAVALIALSSAALAQNQPAPSPPRVSFDSSDVMIPMRDGVKLHTTIFVPKGSTSDLPLILTRTPYGIYRYGRALSTFYRDLADDGYIFVFQDIRGRFGSEGRFQELRDPRDKRDPKAVDEATDTYDTIDWLVKKVPHNNGRVGQLGTSYDGWLTLIAAIEPHPALKAVSPQAAPNSSFFGDDWHHYGAFRPAESFDYATMMGANGGKEMGSFRYETYDTYSWWLAVGSMAHVNERYLKDSLEMWNRYIEHPDFDEFWQVEDVTSRLDSVRVPMLHVGGWWDQENLYGALTNYHTLEKHDPEHKNYLVVGPWSHGGWHMPGGQKLGAIDFGSETAPYFRKNIEAPWFAYWLKGRGTLTLGEATLFEAGSNVWRTFDSWPPKSGVTPRKLYFGPKGTLSFDPPPPAAKDAFDSYLSDPAHPVPYRGRPILPTWAPGSTWSSWLVDDQRFVQDRPDVVAWETPTLTEDLVIAGDISAHLFASTTGSDADWVVKLIDVYPENDAKLPGYELMVSNEVLRGRYRNSFVHPQPIVPNHVDQYTIDLHTQDYRFLKGHRIRVQVQSTWFPLIDRNPQTFVPNIYKAKDTDFRAATMMIHRSVQAASYVELPVAANSGGR